MREKERQRKISTPAPREGSDGAARPKPTSMRYFNPRSPRGERHVGALRLLRELISTPAPREGSDPVRRQAGHAVLISTPAPREGSDDLRQARHAGEQHFNPRSPRGERPSVPSVIQRTAIFQPPLPARGATCDKSEAQAKANEISTPAPREGSDPAFSLPAPEPFISTPAPREGSDGPYRLPPASHTQFQPPLPARGATMMMAM